MTLNASLVGHTDMLSSPDIGLYLCIGGMTAAFLSGMVGFVLVILGPTKSNAESLFAACILAFPTSLFVSFIGFILMCYGFAVQILNLPS